MAKMRQVASSQGNESGPGKQQILDNIAAALKVESEVSYFPYTEKDVMLYNLGVGAKREELTYV